MTRNNEISNLKKQLEKDMIEKVKKNPSLIANIQNPTQIVRNYAIAYFIRQYAHPVAFSTPITIKENNIKEIKTNFEQYLIEKIKTDPTIIKDIPNPTMTIRNNAVAYFMRKYSR